MSIKNPNYNIWNRTCDLPNCGNQLRRRVPQTDMQIYHIIISAVRYMFRPHIVAIFKGVFFEGCYYTGRYNSSQFTGYTVQCDQQT